MRFSFSLASIALLLISCQENSPNPPPGNDAPLLRVEATRPLMGTLFKIVTHTGDREQARLDMEAAFDLVEAFASLATAACLADDPASLFQKWPQASLRVVYEDPEKAPVITGQFEEN